MEQKVSGRAAFAAFATACALFTTSFALMGCGSQQVREAVLSEASSSFEHTGGAVDGMACTPLRTAEGLRFERLLVGTAVVGEGDAADDVLPASEDVAEAIDALVEIAAGESGVVSFSAAHGTDADASGGMPAGDAVSGGAAADEGAPSVSLVEAPGIEAALDAFAEAGCSAGFVACDLTTGLGLAANADASYFSASTVKAPYAAYVSTLLDAGAAHEDDLVMKDVVVDGTGVMAFDDQDSYSLATVVEHTIVHSDNTGYALLRERFGDEGFAEWAAACGAATSSWDGGWYPRYRPADLAKLWLGIADYLASGAQHAAWCADMLARTEMSFLRDAASGDAKVLAKAGYEVDGLINDTGALNDAGLVLGEDGGPYLVVVMSDADFDDTSLTGNQYLIEGLLDAVAAALPSLSA